MCVRMVHVCVKMVHVCVRMVVRMLRNAIFCYYPLLLVCWKVMSFIDILQMLHRCRISLCLFIIGICMMTSSRFRHAYLWYH